MAKGREIYTGSLRSPRDINGIFRARVTNNADPEKLGRVQVRVPMLHGASASDGVSDSSLPWATGCFPSAGYNFGSFVVPEIGEYVFVIFEDNDTSKPVYLGSSYGKNSTTYKEYGSKDTTGLWYGMRGANEVPEEAQLDFPSTKLIYKTRLGSAIYFDTAYEQEKICIIDSVGNTITLNTAEETLSITGANGEEIEMHNGLISIGNGDEEGFFYDVDDNSITTASKEVTIKCEKSFEMKSPKITLRGDVTIVE